jgi:DNA-binding NarL/FixJ family response regulator
MSEYTRPYDDKNPWGLRPREVETLRAVTALGSNKAVGRALSRGAWTIRDHVGVVLRVMDLHDRTVAAVVFDRWDRSQS